jgi:ABC-type multidrug transport system ATPase subunit
MMKKYDEIVAFAELEKFMDQKLKNYSSGMQVRLAFSIAIQAKSEILVLDEVLAVGDEAFQQKCNNYFEEVKNSGQTIVLVSHSMDAVRRFCSRAIFLKDGEISNEGNVYEVADAYLMDNLDQSKKKRNETKNKINFSIEKEDRASVKIKISYDCSKDECFASLSIWSGGMYLGGINTPKEKPLKSSGSLEFTIDKSLLNPGSYGIGGGLFNIRNRSQLAAVKAGDRKIFLVEGEEKQRGGALKLRDTWKF